MDYAAKHYVKVNGKMFMPGEIIDIAIPADKLPRLLKLGAVVPVPVYASPAADDGGRREDMSEESISREMERQNYDAQMNNLGYDPDGNALSESAETPCEGGEEAAEETDAEEDEEAEAPEIDVMAGIVGADEPPARKTGRGRKKT